MGGGSKRVTIGHWLKAYVHMIVCAGPVNFLHELIYGEKTIFKGQVGNTTAIYIDLPNLFGGERADGGVQGLVEVNFGRENEPRSGNIANIQGGNCPAYRGFLSLFFIDFTWSFIVPQFKPLWSRQERTTAGWDNESVWQPNLCAIYRPNGLSTKYTITVAWLPEQLALAQTISYQVQYRLNGGAWVALVDASFSGGSSTSINQKTNGGIAGNSSSPFTQNLTGFNVGEPGGIYTNYSAGVVPSGSRNHVFDLPQDFYEFRVVKTGGTGSTGAGGNVAITARADSLPIYGSCNPAHIIYQLLTQEIWQVQMPISQIDNTTFYNAALTLYNEGFGLNFGFRTTQNAQDLIQEVLEHCGAYTKHNLQTGKVELHLLRANYDINTLTELNNDNSVCVDFQRVMSVKNLVNQVIVKYEDDNGNTKLLAVDNLANQSQVGVVKTEQEYRGFHSRILARRAAMRDLTALSTPLAKMTRRTNRVLWNHAKGDVVRINDPLLGIIGAAYRIADINHGTYTNGEITVELIEDVFGMSQSSFGLLDETPPQLDTAEMQEAENVIVFELPYWVVYFSQSTADLAALPDGYGFVGLLVNRNTVGPYSEIYDFNVSLDNNIYADIGDGDYSPTGYLLDSIGYLDTTLELQNTTGFELDRLADTGYLFALIDDEFVSVETYDIATRIMTVKRGILDTLPQAHASGARLTVILSSNAADTNTRLVGDLVYYKVTPRGTSSVLPLENATEYSITLNDRASRPYPPANVKINDAYYPQTVAGDITVTWAHRDRILQTIDLVGFTEPSIGPEPGTNYVLKVYAGTGTGGTLLYSNITLTTNNFTIPAAPIQNNQVITIELFSMRDGMESWLNYQHTVERTGLGFALGENLGA